VSMALLSPDGRELLDRLAGERVDPGRALELAQALRGRYPPDLVAAALTQQELRVAARAKFSRADQMLFTRAGLEQASSETTAAHSAARYPADGLAADLCCGIGGNLIALGAGRQVLGVDLDPVSLAFARHNAQVYGVADQVAVLRADVRDLALDGVRAVFIDPARRAGGRRLAAGRSEPPLGWCLDLAGRIPAVGIKAAPGLPRELVPAGWEAEFVAVGRDLKEALLWSPALATARSRATVLPSGDTLARPHGPAPADASAGSVPVAEPGAFLLDPSPAVTRAGLVEDLARQLGAWKIDPEIAFLSDDREHRTPFARTLRVLESAPWHERHFARRLRDLGIGAADIRRRGLAGDVPQIHRRLGLRGPGRATLVLTRVSGRPWGLICADTPGSG
jgi:THUMP domain-like/RNA cap guanine-N2 methyltransferase